MKSSKGKLARILAAAAFSCLACLSLTANSGSCSTLDANYQGVVGTGNIVTDGRPLDIAQTFTVENTGTLTNIELLLSTISSTNPPSSALIVDIRTTSGGAPTAADSGANILSTISIAPFNSQSPGWIAIDVPDFAVVAGEVLAITLRTNSPQPYDWLGDIAWPQILSPNGTYAGGQGYLRFFNRGGAWSNVSLCGINNTNCNNPQLVDFDFKTFVDPPVDTTPLPAAFPLFAGGLGLIGLLARRRKKRIIYA